MDLLYREKILMKLSKLQSREEQERLGKFSFEYLIAYSPDKDGYNTSAKKKQPGNKKRFIRFIHVGVMLLKISVKLIITL